MIELILADINPDLCCEFEQAFAGLEDVKVMNSPFQEIEEWDCIITPANSYGIMDGGFDLRVAEFFGPELQRSVQASIFVYHARMQAVGTSLIIETENTKHPFVAHTPTMRFPMIIAGTINVFLAMKAALQAILNHNDNGGGEHRKYIERVICPGLGTATGGVTFNVAADQMRAAYDIVFDSPRRMNWEVVREIEGRLRGGYYA
ncbi:macro domain-containing protein [Paenibacillus graminis]|uniref:Macro domain-containing protein n=1 Tax=Paenibacillus graminis TaxID=189425 RepID=A0A089NKE6_9BACL|nr:macro domain-containing protein [Paenibacillus graminis]AIQ69524.1 hypothetical protein PGRAT_19215 [Paenibacillus graminis]